jgi:HK97 family phage major capsid protein
MSDRLDLVLAQMKSMTDAIQEKAAAGENPKTALQWDEIEKDFSDRIQAVVDAQVDAKLAAQPQRRIPGDGIPANGDVELKNNRYSRIVKQLAETGKANMGGQVVRPVDLLIAHQMIEGQFKHYHASQGGGVAAPASDELKAAIKALSAGGAGTGAEYVPTDLAANLWDDFFLASRVVSTLNRIDMPTNPFDIPLGLGQPTWRKGSENQATAVSNPPTAKSILTATELVTEQQWSYTLDEDAIIAMAPAMRARLAQSGAEIMDDFALNADATDAATGNINSDDAAPNADAYYLSAGQDGLRHQWIVDNTTQGHDMSGALTDAGITTTLTKMGKYAVDPMRLVVFCDVSTYLNGFLASGAGKPGEYLATLDKMGTNAVLLTGQLAAYRGIPIVVSASHRLAAADAKVDTATPANNTKGSLTIVNRDMWYVGFRRNLLMEVDRDIQRRQYIMVTSLREAIAAYGTRATALHVAGMRNITV